MEPNGSPLKTILSSASKIVFILMAVGSIALTFMGKMEAKEFMTLAAMAFAFYFTGSKPSGTA